ncbi:MAG: MFS transporter [Methanosarcinales archaeon]|nr:MAG: MFS transporter [Methanosarcinales archaeon]
MAERSIFRIHHKLYILTASLFFGDLGTGILMLLIPMYIKHLGGGMGMSIEIKSALAFGVFGLFAAASYPVMGRLSDRINRRKPFVLAGLAGFTVLSAACANIDTFEQLLMIRVAQGIMVGVMVPSVLAMLTHISTPDNRGRSMGAYSTVRGIGSAVGPATGGVIAATGGFGAGFYACAALGLSSIIFVAFFVEEPRVSGTPNASGTPNIPGTALSENQVMYPRKERGETHSFDAVFSPPRGSAHSPLKSNDLVISLKNSAVPTGTSSTAGGKTNCPPDSSNSAANAEIKLLASAAFTTMFAIMIIATLLPLYETRLCASTAELGAALAAYFSARLIFQMPMGVLSDLISTRRVVVAGLGVSALLLPLIAHVTTTPEFLTLMFAIGTAAAAVNTPALAFGADLSCPGMVGQQLSLFPMASAIGMVAGPLVGGVFASYIGFTAPFYLCAGLMVIVGALVMIRGR